MPQFIESLESRTLFSAASALATLQTDAKALTATVTAFKKVEKADVALVKADLKAAGEAKSSHAVFHTLQADGKADLALVSKDVHKAISQVKKDVKKGIAVVKKLLHKPGNIALEDKLETDIVTLQIHASANLTKITNDLNTQQATDAANLTAVVSANPTDTQLATDANTTIPANGHPAQVAVSTAANLFLVTDVNALVATV